MCVLFCIIILVLVIIAMLFIPLLSSFGFLARFPWFMVSMLIVMDEVNSCALKWCKGGPLLLGLCGCIFFGLFLALLVGIHISTSSQGRDFFLIQLLLSCSNQNKLLQQNSSPRWFVLVFGELDAVVLDLEKCKDQQCISSCWHMCQCCGASSSRITWSMHPPNVPLHNPGTALPYCLELSGSVRIHFHLLLAFLVGALIWTCRKHPESNQLNRSISQG